MLNFPLVIFLILKICKDVAINNLKKKLSKKRQTLKMLKK